MTDLPPRASSEEALAWYVAHFPVPWAQAYLRAGWTSAQVIELDRLTRPNGAETLADWLHLSLPPDRVLRFVAAGVLPDEAPLHHQVDDTTLDVLAALRATVSRPGLASGPPDPR